MKYILTAFCCFVFISSFSQKTYFGGITIDFHQKFFNDDFYKNLKSINNIESNNLPVNAISISFTNYLNTSRGFNFPAYSCFSFVLPTKVSIDSLSNTLRGFNLNLPFYGHKLIDKKHIGIFISEGIQIGRLKLVNTQKQKMKNMIIAPYVGLLSKINISKLSVTIRAQYEYDISSKMWKKQWFHKGQDIHIPGIRQSGLTFSAGVGYSLGN